MSAEIVESKITVLHAVANALLDLGEQALNEGEPILALGYAAEAAKVTKEARQHIIDYGCGC